MNSLVSQTSAIYYVLPSATVVVAYRNVWTHLNLLSVPQIGGGGVKMFW